MKDFDFGYFGTGDEGFAQYMTAFERNFGTEDANGDFDLDDAKDFGSEEDATSF